jgi:hypothetical protein
LIKELIRSGHLRKLIEKAAQRHEERSDTTKVPRSPDTEEDKGKDTVRITVNTTAEGFAGGGESSSARKRYLRRSGREAHLINHVDVPPAPDLSFSPSDAKGEVPQDDDPLVIQVQILNCDVKRVLIDTRSSTDIIYKDLERNEPQVLLQLRCEDFSSVLVMRRLQLSIGNEPH